MTNDPKRHPLTEIPMILPAPAPDQFVERLEIEYGQGEQGPLTLDVYAPANRGCVALPAVLLVGGYSDLGYARHFGCRFKESAMATSWAKIVTSFGLIAITYGNARPADDLDSVLAYVRAHAAQLGVDRERIGLWGVSAHGALALAALAKAPRGSFRWGVFSCAYLTDLDGTTHVAHAATQWGFANPGTSLAGLPGDLPLFIARAGQEQNPGVNPTLDRFVAAALARNLRVTCVNVADAPHAFEMFRDTVETREVMRQMLRFARFHLAGPAADDVNL
jgi:acetyl esterase/lipase